MDGLGRCRDSCLVAPTGEHATKVEWSGTVNTSHQINVSWISPKRVKESRVVMCNQSHLFTRLSLIHANGFTLLFVLVDSQFDLGVPSL